VLTRITDTGIGIPRRELVRIFDRFHQVDPSIRRRYGGMGLGLSLVHSIVESHRGLVWAESEGDQGSTFLVWLPCHAGDDGDASEGRPPV
jgi:signal transduction histidine kinase